MREVAMIIGPFNMAISVTIGTAGQVNFDLDNWRQIRKRWPFCYTFIHTHPHGYDILSSLDNILIRSIAAVADPHYIRFGIYLPTTGLVRIWNAHYWPKLDIWKDLDPNERLPRELMMEELKRSEIVDFTRYHSNHLTFMGALSNTTAGG